MKNFCERLNALLHSPEAAYFMVGLNLISAAASVIGGLWLLVFLCVLMAVNHSLLYLNKEDL